MRKAGGLRNIESDRRGVNQTVPIPMRDLAKLKILEVSTISWQYTGWSLVYLQHFGVLLGLVSAVGPEIIVQFGIKNTYILTQQTVNIVKFEIILMLVYNGARCVHICKIYAVKHVQNV